MYIVHKQIEWCGTSHVNHNLRTFASRLGEYVSTREMRSEHTASGLHTGRLRDFELTPRSWTRIDWDILLVRRSSKVWIKEHDRIEIYLKKSKWICLWKWKAQARLGNPVPYLDMQLHQNGSSVQLRPRLGLLCTRAENLTVLSVLHNPATLRQCLAWAVPKLLLGPLGLCGVKLRQEDSLDSFYHKLNRSAFLIPRWNHESRMGS